MKIRFLFLVVALLCVSLVGQAQTSRGTVSGTVTDQTGAVIPGAAVALTSTDTNVERTATTNDEGFYRFDAVDLGNYSVSITAANFGTVTKTGIVVNANQTSTVEAQLAAGSQEVTVDVTAESGALLQSEAPVRGGNISTAQITELPIASRNPVSLALTLPGVTSNRGGFGVDTFVVNGARGRSNNFLIDGTENNDISVAGQAFQVTNPDAIQEVSVQTSNYDAEFGRAGGAVVNLITKSGTNNFRGTLSFIYDSSADDAITSLQSRNPAVIRRGRPFSNTQFIPAFTIGGPVFFPRFGEGGPVLYNGRDRTFFFGAYQEDRFRSPGAPVSLTTLTQAGRDRLRALFPAGTNANVDTYLAATANSVATVANQPPILLDSSDVPEAQRTRGQLEAGTFFRPFQTLSINKQLQFRFDHSISENDQLSARILTDRTVEPGGGVAGFEGFDADLSSRNYNFLITETHVFSPTFTNELRLAYNRIVFGFPIADAGGLAATLPQLNVGGGLDPLGISAVFPQGRTANNYTIQDTATKVIGDHTVRGGVDFLRQISTQIAPANTRGSLTFAAGGGFSSFANFVDNFGGIGGAASRVFGSATYNPTLYRTAVFLQDRWKATDALTLTYGLRYENFGTPFNQLRTPAYTGLFNVDPVTRTGPFSAPNKIPADNNNFAPTLGVAYSPSSGGLLGGIFGERKTVIRAGYQIGYDSFFNNIASNAVASSPNTIGALTSSTVASGARGLANFSSQFPATAPPLSPLSPQTLIAPNLVNPYYQRYSLGLQRELPFRTVVDISYVGSKGTKLFINEDANPMVSNPALRITPTGVTTGLSGRLDNIQGARTVRTNGGSSSYNSGQIEVRRRFANNFQITGAYTFSKYISNADEVFAGGLASTTSFFAVPAVFGGDRLDRAVSLFDRTHKASITYVVESPFFREQRGIVGKLLGGFQFSGVTTFESGVPFTIFNGFDADGLGGGLDRPTLNPNGQRGVRAVPVVDTAATVVVNGVTVANPNQGAITGYINPEVITGRTSSGSPIFQPIDPNTAQFIVNPTFVPSQPRSIPRSGNLARNSERTPGLNNTNLAVLKRVRFGERRAIEARADFFNAFNHPQFPSSGSIPSVASSLTQNLFLNPDNPNTSGGGREIRYQVKLIF